MSAAFEVRADGMPGIEARLGRLLAANRDLSPLMDRLGLYFEGETIQHFEDERAPDGAPWEPSLRVKQGGGKTLTLSGRLKNSITYEHSSDRVAIGTKVIYAGAHQGGAVIRPKDGGKLTFKIPGIGFRSMAEVILPARPFLGVGTHDEAEVEALAEEYELDAVQ